MQVEQIESLQVNSTKPADQERTLVIKDHIFDIYLITLSMTILKVIYVKWIIFGC